MEKITVNPARRAAFASLCKMRAGKYANIEVDVTLRRTSLSEADRRLYTALVYGVIERLLTLDYVIETLSIRPMGELQEEVLCALRMGLYQLRYLDRIPAHAAVDESVELAPRKARGFVNGVLRSYQRAYGDGQALPLPKEALRRLSVTYSIPSALCSAFVEWYGADTAEHIFQAFFRHLPTNLRLNTLRHTDAAAFGAATELCAACFAAEDSAAMLYGIENGDWFVQDAASALCARAVGALPGETVIDVCAAPGGKSFSMAMDMENRGKLYAFDLHENKLSLIEKGAKKLGIGIITTGARDARTPAEDLIGKADRVLCDAPCSGLGVIGKKPDIKYKDLGSVKRLPQVQYAVLCGAAEYVRSGGTLVYSTCTLNPAENGGVTEQFLAAHPEFVPEPFAVGDAIQSAHTLFPHIHGTDGFYICKMRRL